MDPRQEPRHRCGGPALYWTPGDLRSPRGGGVYNKNVVNGLTVTDSSNCDNQSASLYVNRATYGNGDSFGIAALLSYQGTIMSGSGDEGSVAVNAEIRHDIDCFWGVVESYDKQLHHLVYRPPDASPASPIATGKLGTSRPLINMNPAKWDQTGKVLVVASGHLYLREGTEIDIQSSLIIGNQDVNWDESVVGRFIAIVGHDGDHSEYYDTDEETAEHIHPRRPVHRWWFITGIRARKDGLTSLYVEETWWLVDPRRGPALFTFDNYTTDENHTPKLDYIIAPGAWVSDVRDGVSSRELGHPSATAEDGRLIVLAPSSTDGASLPDGTSLDFEPNDPITNALGANVWQPSGVRVRHFDNFPGTQAGNSFQAENHGKVQMGAGLWIDSPDARTLEEAATNHKDKKPAYESGIYVFASTDAALTVRGEVKTAAIDLWQVNGKKQRILWRTKAPVGGSTLYADPGSGDFVFTGGNIDHQHLGTLNQHGISGTPVAAKHLRRINVSALADTTLKDISFVPPAEPQGEPEPDAHYAVWVTCSWPTTTAIASKTSVGFQILFGTPVPAGGGTLDWLLVR